MPRYRVLDRLPGLAQRVREEILAMVSSGDLKPGDRLPAERSLAQKLGVSRNVVREALRSLASMNVVDIRQGSGAFVSSLDIDSLIAPLEYAVALDQAALEHLAEARLVLEPAIASLAAERATEGDVAALRAIVRDSRVLVDDPDRFVEADVTLHRKIVEIARNPVLGRVIESLGRLIRASHEFTTTSGAIRVQAARDHDRVVETLAARDAAGAAAAMRDHLMHVESVLVSRLDGDRS